MKWLALGLAALAILVMAWLAVEVRYAACLQASPVHVGVDSKLRGGDVFDPPTFAEIESARVTRDVYSGCWHP